MTSDSTVLLGPIVRYVGTETATLWFEMAESATISVVTDAGVRGTAEGMVVMPLVCPCCRERGTAVVPAET
jgi:hypothetical protein